MAHLDSKEEVFLHLVGSFSLCFITASDIYLMFPGVCHMTAIDGDGRVLFYSPFLFCPPVYSFFLSPSIQTNEFRAIGQWRSSKRYQIKGKENSGQVAHMPEIGWILGFLLLRCAHGSLLPTAHLYHANITTNAKCPSRSHKNLPTSIACPPRFLLCSSWPSLALSTHTHPSSCARSMDTSLE